jgi:hypothetical protein
MSIREKAERTKSQLKMHEMHQWLDVDRKDETHQRQHPVTSASYE